jgi:hypothetical protein
MRAFPAHLPRSGRACAEGLAELREFLERFWDDRLETLKREAENEERIRHGNDD